MVWLGKQEEETGSGEGEGEVGLSKCKHWDGVSSRQGPLKWLGGGWWQGVEHRADRDVPFQYVDTNLNSP